MLLCNLASLDGQRGTISTKPFACAYQLLFRRDHCLVFSQYRFDNMLSPFCLFSLLLARLVPGIMTWVRDAVYMRATENADAMWGMTAFTGAL
jgi:hypothetical protein